MKVKNDEIAVIIEKAKEIGLICKTNEDNESKIHLKNDYILSTTDIKNYWLLSFKGNSEMYLSNWEILEMLQIVTT